MGAEVEGHKRHLGKGVAVVRALGSLSLAVAVLLALAGGARSGPGDWSLLNKQSEPEWTNVDAHHAHFTYVGPHEKSNNAGRAAHLLRVRMPRSEPPNGHAMATITRSFSVTEGDRVKLRFFGDPDESDARPAPEVLVYVECLVPTPSGSTEDDWVEIGSDTVNTNTHGQTLTAKIKGKGCDEVVALGKNRQIKGARIQLLGAKRKRDRQARSVYLERFELLNPGDNTPVVDDDFSKEK